MEPSKHGPNGPSPTLWPAGFAVGIAVLLVGLIVDPMVISSIGAVIAIVFGALWVRDATSELRGRPAPVEPETRELRAAAAAAAAAEAPPSAPRFARSILAEYERSVTAGD